MNRLALVLLISSAVCLAAQKLKQDDLNIYVTHTSALFASNVSDFDHLDVRNSRAVHIDSDGHKGEWQALKQGRGKTDYVTNYGVYQGGTEVDIGWIRRIDSEHMVVDYGWVWMAGSSSQSDIVQVFELRDGKVFITQQIEADTHGGDTAAGVRFDERTKRLIVKAVELDSPNGRCCPTRLNVVVFRWDGGKFRQISARQVPIPPKRSDRQVPPTAARGTRPYTASR
jgi:hypothetical protein